MTFICFIIIFWSLLISLALIIVETIFHWNNIDYNFVMFVNKFTIFVSSAILITLITLYFF